MENIKKNYIRVVVMLVMATVFIIGLYVYSFYIDESSGDSSNDDIFLGIFTGIFIIAALLVFAMMYVFGALILLCFLFATIARFSYKGEADKLNFYRGLMNTTYVFLILLDCGIIMFSGFLGGTIGFIFAIVYTVFVIRNIIVCSNAYVIEVSKNNYYPNMYYQQGIDYNNPYSNNGYNNH